MLKIYFIIGYHWLYYILGCPPNWLFYWSPTSVGIGKLFQYQVYSERVSLTSNFFCSLLAISNVLFKLMLCRYYLVSLINLLSESSCIPEFLMFIVPLLYCLDNDQTLLQYINLKIQMIEQSHSAFLAWVKIRIGEPLTAIQVDREKITFGSISGYIGYYDLEMKKVHYFEPINQEIIRGIYSQKSKLYFAIGDRYVLIKDVHEKKDERIMIIRSHSNNVCSHSMTMMYGLKQVIFCAFPTQKRQSLPTDLDIQKSNLYQIYIDRSQIKTHRDFKMPQLYVPFDFDGKRILWMEYKEGDVKQFQFYDLASNKIVPVKNFGKQYHFLSFGRIINKDIIFVQNNKNVKLLNMDNNSVKDLYSHTSSIIAFDIIGRQQESYQIASVDFNGVFQLWKNDNIARKQNLWETKSVPQEIKKHQFLFDMGYPYYLKVFKSIVAITTDLGLCIFKI